MTSVFTRAFNLEFNPLTRRFKLQKHATFKNGWKEEAHLMTSLALIFTIIYGKEKAFLSGDVVNVPRNVEDATKCCNAGTRSAQ